MRTGRAIQLEVESRKKHGTDFRNMAADGPYLRIQGALWQLPVRASAARPKFVDGKPTFEETADQFQAAQVMLDTRPDGGDGVEIKTCATCGHRRVEFDILAQAQWLTAALACAAEALAGPGGKYNLSDDQLSDLLCVEPDSAEWLTQLSQWALGKDTAPPPAVVPNYGLDSLLNVPLTPTPPPRRSFWQRLGDLIHG